MYGWLAIIISIPITFIIVFLFAKLKIFDFIGKFSLGCGTYGLFRLLEVVVVFFVTFLIVSSFFDKTLRENFDYSKTYLTTKVELFSYNKIEKEPYGKETGKVRVDTVLKVMNAKKRGSITWLDSYILENNTAKHVFVIIPDSKIEVKKSNQYYDFNERSRSFSAYYQMIDAKNAVILANIRKEYEAKLNEAHISIEYSASNIIKESIKKTHYFLPKDGYSSPGYFGLFKTETSVDFWYIPKENKKLFKKITFFFYKKLEKETIPYFQK